MNITPLKITMSATIYVDFYALGYGNDAGWFWCVGKYQPYGKRESKLEQTLLKHIQTSHSRIKEDLDYQYLPQHHH